MEHSGTGRQIVRSAFSLDWSRFEPVAALRCSVGVAVPLLAGLSLGQPAVSAFGAVGAVSVGFGSFQGAYRSRAGAMVWAAVGMAVAVVAGSLAGHNGIVAALVAMLFAFGAALLVALGPAAAFVGLQSVVAVLVAEGFPADLAGAATRAALVLAGGLVQTLLVVVLWPLRRFSAERAALADVYRSLATYARGLTHNSLLAPEPHTLAAAQAPLTDPHPFARVGEVLVFQALFDEADRIRASLAAVATRFARDTDEDSCVEAFTAQVGGVLEEIAACLEHARAPAERSADWAAMDRCAGALRRPDAVDSLLGQLRTSWRLAATPTDTVENAQAIRLPPLIRRPPVHDGISTIAANFTIESATFRHALRLAGTVGIATAAYRLLALPRGYWIPMTALLVLKPEFYDTFSRGLARIAGTLGGVLIATAIDRSVHPGDSVLPVLVIANVWACYAVFRINYALFAVFVTQYVVFILMLSGAPEMPTASARALYTICGGALGILAYAIWPTWAGRSAWAALASMIDAHREYVDAILETFTAGGRPDLPRLAALRARGRLARSNAEATVERMLAEPPSHASLTPAVAVGMLAALRRNALAALALHAALERGDRPPDPSLAPLQSAIVDAFTAIATALRTGLPPAALPPLRRVERVFARSNPDVLRNELDLIVDSVDTIAELLGAGSALP